MQRRCLVALVLLLIAFPLMSTARADAVSTNRQLARELTDHRTYADSDPGNYGYAKYIQKITYRGRDRIRVSVSTDFRRLNAADRTAVMNQVQALAKMVLVERHKIKPRQARRGLMITIASHDKVIGRSRAVNHYRYEW